MIYISVRRFPYLPTHPSIHSSKIYGMLTMLDTARVLEIQNKKNRSVGPEQIPISATAARIRKRGE